MSAVRYVHVVRVTFTLFPAGRPVPSGEWNKSIVGSTVAKWLTSPYRLVRPPGTTVPDGLMFYPYDVSFFYSPRFFRDPSTDRPETLPHDQNLAVFYKLTSKIRGVLPQKNLGRKTCRISVNFWPLQTLIAKISPERGNISKIGKTYKLGKFLLRLRKKSGELWSTNGLELHVSLDPLKCTFWHTISQPLGGAAPWNFYTR